MGASEESRPEVPPDPAPAAPEADLAPSAQADEALLRKVLHVPAEGAGQPADVSQALDQASKQFQLWNIRRQEIDPDELRAIKRERVEIPEPVLDSASSEVKSVMAEATKALSKFVPASNLANKGFTGFKALKRVVLGKPYKTNG